MTRKSKKQQVIKELVKKDAAADLSAAIIRANKKDRDSNAALIESLNRYIATLENKLTYQAELIKNLEQRLKDILAKPKKRPR